LIKEPRNIEEFRELLKFQLGIIGNSDILNQTVDELIQIAPTDLTVLILGETGTGKEVFANAIHKLSKRSKYPFLSVNCAAIPETLLESELFGYEKGAFTGAQDRRLGFFETANKGTLLLDEIGEMPLSIQVKLLRILESGEFSRLGSSEVRKVDVRIIAATNRNLEIEVQKGAFRQDLYYRLNSVKLVLPSLKDRREDIPVLFDYFANRAAEINKFKYEGIAEEAISLLKKMEWQGNVRELKNFTEKVVTLERGKFITLPILQKYLPAALPIKSAVFQEQEHNLIPIKQNENYKDFEITLLLKALFQIETKIEALKTQNDKIIEEIENLKQDVYQIQSGNYYSVEDVISDKDWLENLQTLNVEEVEKQLIKYALSKNKGNRKLAAQDLGFSLRTLYRKLSYYNIE
jgi:transcriptional regulator with PAS, ATPase and Fis domain